MLCIKDGMLEREINTEIMYNHWISYKTEIMKLNENKWK